MSLIGSWTGVGLEQPDLIWLALDADRVQCEHSRFHANRSLDLFAKSRFVCVKLGRIDLQLSQTHERGWVALGRCRERAQEGNSNQRDRTRGAKYAGFHHQF